MNKQYGRADLARIAAKDMANRGLTAEFSTSIDNEESRDLDQLTVCEHLPNGALKSWWPLQMRNADLLILKKLNRD